MGIDLSRQINCCMIAHIMFMSRAVLILFVGLGLGHEGSILIGRPQIASGFAKEIHQLPQVVGGGRSSLELDAVDPHGEKQVVKASNSSDAPSEGRQYLKETYEDWLKVMFKEMYGQKWVDLAPSQRPINICKNNLALVNQGCQFMIHTCYSNPLENPDCVTSYFKSCTCSETSSNFFLRLLIPKVRTCHSSIKTDDEIMEELGYPPTLDDEDFQGENYEEVMFIMGTCRISGVFLAWLCIPIVLFIVLCSYSYKFYKKYMHPMISPPKVDPPKKSLSNDEPSLKSLGSIMYQPSKAYSVAFKKE